MELTDSALSSLPLSPSGTDIGPGDHVCALYRGTDGRDDIMLPFLGRGIEQGDKCVAVLDDAEPTDVARQLEQLCEVDAALECSQLELHRSLDTYLRGGVGFDGAEMLAFWDAAVDRGTRAGYETTRALGEMTWALRNYPGVDGLIEYEAELNTVITSSPRTVVCLYDLDQFDGSIVVDLLRTHPKLLVTGRLLTNPYFQAPGELLEDRAAADLA